MSLMDSTKKPSVPSELIPDSLELNDSPKLTLAELQKYKDRRELEAWANSVYHEMKSSRNRVQMQWCLNLAFYYGNQYMQIVPKTGKLTTPLAPRHRVRLVINRVRAVVRTELARLTSQRPSATVVPASSDDEDMFAAYAGEQIWESLTSSSHGDLQRHFGQAIFWTVLTGTGFIKTWWDPDALDADNNVNGDVKFGAVTPFHLFVPNLREINLQDQPYMLNAYTKPVAWVQQYYGDSLDFNVNADAVGSNELLDDVYLSLGQTGKTEPDSVLCKELWVKPGAHKLLPKGGMLHLINNKIVAMYPEGIPYRHMQYPFTKFEHIPTGKFYSDSVVTDIIPLQREYNRGRSQIIENRNRMSKLQYTYAIGSLDPTKITTEPGQAIPYKLGMPPPSVIPLQPLPAYVTQDLDRSLMDIEDLSGQHQVSKGQVPPGVTAATAISFLQEKDDSILSTTYNSVERGMEEIARQTLSLVVQYWDLPRMVKVAGANGAFDSFQLHGAKLEKGTDIRMEGGSSLPTSKAARQAFIMDCMKMGFIDVNDGLKLLEVGGIQKLWEKLKVDEAQAQRENIRMKRLDEMTIQQHTLQFQQNQQMGDPETIDVATGMPLQPPPVVSVNTWDNHQVHIDVHNNYRKTQAFELLPDAVKAQFEQHVNAHLAAVTSALQEVQNFQQFGGPEPPAPDMMGEEGTGEEMSGEMPPEESAVPQMGG